MSQRLARPAFALELPALRTDHQRARIRKSAYRPRLEALEGRCLPSITLNNGVLQVTCDTPTELSGSNVVELNAHDSPNIHAVILTANRGLQESGTFDPSVVSQIYLNGSAAGGDLFFIAQTLATAPVAVNYFSNSGGPNDDVGIQGNLLDLQGPVAIYDHNGSISVEVDYTDSPALTAYVSSVVTEPQIGVIYALGGAPILYDYGQTRSVEFDTNVGAVINVEATGTPTHIFTERSAIVNVGKQGTLEGIQGELDIEMPIKQGLNTIHIDDSSEPSPLQDVVLGTFRGDNGSLWGYVQGLAPANINYKYDDTQSLTIDTGSGGDTLAVQTTGTDTTLNLGDGTNVVNITPFDSSSPTGFQAQSLDFLGGNLTVNGGTGSNILVLDDVANTNQSTWTLAGDTVSRTYTPVTRTINYSQIGNLRIEAGSGGNEFALDPLGENLADLPASVDLQAAGGSTTLNLFDQNDQTPLDWTVTGSEIDRFTQGVQMGVEIGRSRWQADWLHSCLLQNPPKRFAELGVPIH
jgi:hypothetical protein